MINSKNLQQKNMQNQVRKFISEGTSYEIVLIADGKFNLLSKDTSPAKLIFCGNTSEIEKYLKSKFPNIFDV